MIISYKNINIENKIKHTFTSNEIVFNKNLGAEIKNVKVMGIAR